MLILNLLPIYGKILLAMGQAVQEKERLRLKFGKSLAQNYQEAMERLEQIADQFPLVARPGETISHLVALWDALVSSRPEDPLEERLVPLTEQDVEALGRDGSFRILSLLKEKPLAQLKYKPFDSPFNDLYDCLNPLTVVDLCPEGDEDKPGMRLIAIKRERLEGVSIDEFSYNVGWVTEEELKSLIQE